MGTRHVRHAVSPFAEPAVLRHVADDAVRLARTGYREEIAKRAVHPHRVAADKHVPRMVETERQLSEDVLLGVLRAALVCDHTQRADVSRRTPCDDARIDRLKERSHRSPAALPHASHAILHDVVPRKEVVDCPHTIPDALLRRTLTEKRRKCAVPVVRTASDSAGHLLALALRERIVNERDKTGTRAHHAAALVEIRSLRLRRVSARYNDSAMRRLELHRVRHERKRSDVNSRTALEQHLLNAISVTLNLLRHLRVERRTLEAESSDGSDKPLAHPRAISVVFGAALERAPGVVRRLVRRTQLLEYRVVRGKFRAWWKDARTERVFNLALNVRRSEHAEQQPAEQCQHCLVFSRLHTTLLIVTALQTLLGYHEYYIIPAFAWGNLKLVKI